MAPIANEPSPDIGPAHNDFTESSLASACIAFIFCATPPDNTMSFISILVTTVINPLY